jgi:hypothetical protein
VRIIPPFPPTTDVLFMLARKCQTPAVTILTIIVLGFAALVPGDARGQLPAASLDRIWPFAGEAGTKFEVVAEGDFLDEASRLIFSDPSVTAEVIPGEIAPGDSEPTPRFGHFRVQIPEGIADQDLDVWVAGRFGVSNPRKFVVNSAQTIVADQPRDRPESATEIQMGHRIVAQTLPQQIDHYRLGLAENETVDLNLRAQDLDSRLVPSLTILNSRGEELYRTRGTKSADLHFRWTAPTADDYIVQVSDVLFRGGAGFIYQLAATPPADNPPPSREASDPALVAGPFLTSADTSSLPVREAIADTPQPLEVPLRYRTSFGGTESHSPEFDFHAVGGIPLYIEIISTRLGAATDPQLIIGRVEDAGNGQTSFKRLQEVDDVDVLAGSLLGGRSKDPVTRFVPPETGLYRLIVRDLQTTSDPDWDKSFTVVIREPEPDFDLLAMLSHPMHDPAQASQRGSFLRRGERMVIEVGIVPRDGFFDPIRSRSTVAGGDLVIDHTIDWKWPVQISIEGLPDHVSYQPVQLDKANQRTHIVITADAEAAAWTGPIQVVGTIAIPPEFGGRSLVRRAQTMTIQMGDPDGRGRAPVRPTEQLMVAVTDAETAPLRITLGDAPHQVSCKVGSKVELPVRIERGENCKGKVILRPLGLPANVTAGEINLEGETLESTWTINAAANATPGTYQILLNAECEINWPRNPEALARAEARLTRLRESADAAAEADKEVIAKQIGELEMQIQQLRESTKPQKTRLFAPSNTVQVQIDAE